MSDAPTVIAFCVTWGALATLALLTAWLHEHDPRR